MSNTTPAAQTAQTHHGLDKVKRYGWTMKDKPGTMMSLHKDVLNIDTAYQRELNDSKAKSIAANWSWIACGAVIVGKRGNAYWVCLKQPTVPQHFMRRVAPKFGQKAC